MATGAALADILEAETSLCDRCKEARGIDFILRFWACAQCIATLLQELECERYYGSSAWF